MRLDDYFRGYTLELGSSLQRDEIERRINAATLSRWSPLQSGVVGFARRGSVRLRYRAPRFRKNDLSPILSGNIEQASGGSRLRLRFSAPASVYLFFAGWYAILTLFVLVALISGATATLSGAERLYAALTVLAFTAVPIGLHYLGTRDAEAHWVALVGFVREQAEATHSGSGRRPWK